MLLMCLTSTVLNHPAGIQTCLECQYLIACYPAAFPLLHLAAAEAADNSSNSHPQLWYRAIDAVIAASSGLLRCYRPYYSISSTPPADGGNMLASGNWTLGHQSTAAAVPGMCFLHPPNQPLKESTWGLGLVKSALHAGCWPMQQVGKVRQQHPPNASYEALLTAICYAAICYSLQPGKPNQSQNVAHGASTASTHSSSYFPGYSG